MASVLWFQGGACSGNTMSFLNADEPNVVDLITDFGLDLLWHPSLGLELGDNAQRLFEDCATGDRPMDIFVYEGTVMHGPNRRSSRSRRSAGARRWTSGPEARRDVHDDEAISARGRRSAADRPPPRIGWQPAGERDVKSVTFVNAAARAAGAAATTTATDAAAGPGPGVGRPPGNADPAAGWRPQTWLGAPAPGGLALPSAQPTASWLYAPRGVYLGPADGRPTVRPGGSDGRLRSDAGRAAGQPGRPGGDVLVVADTGNHRVLIWHQAPERDEQPCDVVLGQPDAFSDGPAAGRGDSRARPPPADRGAHARGQAGRRRRLAPPRPHL